MAEGARSIHVGGKFSLELIDKPQVGPVVVKFPTAAVPSPTTLTRLEHEYTLGASLRLPGVREVVGRTTWKGRPALELSYVAGVTFRSYFQVPEHREIRAVLRLAVSAVAVLETLHAEGVTHRDVATSNLLVAEGGVRAVLIDLGLATRPGTVTSEPVSAIEGQLPFLAPEQTGRIDLAVDARSDLYSFGVVLYYMLTGALPFQADDASGWIHAHLARLPEPPHARVGGLPPALSSVVLRLLAKVPDDRYQTARGLRHDLEGCLEELEKTGGIRPFALGRGDRSGRLRFPRHLYGRQREVDALRSALRRAVSGEPGLVLVTGYAGSGKTALVDELRFPIVEAGGSFLSGKYDQTLRGVPYVAFGAALGQFCRQLLGGTPSELQSFRDRVLEALGANVALVAALVPELERIVGPQPQPPALATAESSNRFALTLLALFHVLVEADRPLVLFLDDLQWADASSLELMKLIVTRSVRRRFLVICACREGEPGFEPVRTLVDGLEREWGRIERIGVSGLTPAESKALVAGALDVPEAQAAPLAETLHAKADGNPMFLRQVLQALVRDGVLTFDPQAEQWVWDPVRVGAQDISDSLIGLMLRKIGSLPPATVAALQAAACVGNTFSLDLVDACLDAPGEPARQRLAPAVDDGLVAPLDGTARFTHDRIQQAVYESLAPAAAQQLHLRLGRILIAECSARDGAPGEPLLVAVQQLNLGAPAMVDPAERLRLAWLNHRAGRVAKAAMAYASARDFFSQGERLLAGTSEPQLGFDLRVQLAELAFYGGDVSGAVVRLRELLEETQSPVARAHLYEQLIDLHTVELDLETALELGKQALVELGVSLPSDRSPAAVAAGVASVDRMLPAQGIRAVAERPEMTDERELAIMGLLTHLSPTAYIVGSDLFPFLTIELVRRALAGGLSSPAAFGFCSYGTVLAFVTKRLDDAAAFGRLAVDVVDRLRAEPVRARVTFYYAVLAQHWREPLEATLPLLHAGAKSGVETGDLQFASYCINHIHGNGLLAGQSLAALECSHARYRETSDLIRQEDGQHFFAILGRSIRVLREPSDAPPDIAADYGGAALIDLWRRAGNSTMLGFYHTLVALLAVVFERHDDALAAAELGAVEGARGIAGMTWAAELQFVHGLALASACRSSRLERTVGVARVAEQRNLLAAGAAESPRNYAAKHHLLDAEVHDLEAADSGVVLEAYDAAIEAAASAGRTLDEALACERAAGCWSRRDKPHLAAMYLQRALHRYEAWGAAAKVAQLVRDHSSLLGRAHRGGAADTSSSPSSSGGLHAIDIHSVLKAAQTVAGELVMDRMLARLIELLVETAGAERGYLLLDRDGEWRVVAEHRADGGGVEVLEWRSLADHPDIGASVVHFVARTLESVRLDDAASSAVFGIDANIARRGCKSILCLPILNRGGLGGILYLENNLATYAFTRTHSRILQLLTMPAISSLEISRYYARVQSLNQSLAAEIDERKRTESKLEFLANHDALTQLPNRRLFYDRVQHAIARAERTGGRVAVLFLDLDQFKTINDSLSHQVGDCLLQAVAKRLAELARGGDTLARLGGDEYVLLVEEPKELRDLATVAERLVSAFHEPFCVSGFTLYPTASLGISLYPDDARDADELLRNADAAMYQAKGKGRNSYHFFSADLAAAANNRLTLENDLRRAVERSEFELYFQPQVSLESGRVVGGEALIRWNHPSRGLLPPETFIHVAEECGAIIAIGEWVLRQACAQLGAWRRAGVTIGSLAVNVSSSQFAWTGGFSGLVRRILGESGVEPERLEIELTESTLMQDTDHALRSVADLNELGVRLAIDDFGTGYSSLSYLKRLPVQRLKVDRSFVANLPMAADDATIVESIMILGKKLGKQVIAEGVETVEQRDFLRQAGCALGQGFYFGRPMPRDAFTELLRGSC